MVYYNNKAAVYVELKRYQDARDLSEKAADIGRSNRADFTLIAKAYARIATCHEKESNLELAIKYFNKSLSEHRDKKILDKVNKVRKSFIFFNVFNINIILVYLIHLFNT